MKELVDLLHEGGYSCVIRNGADLQTFTQRGVADLYHLYRHNPKFLQGADIADKVVGKGAAALMALGGVARLHTDIISSPAKTLLKEYGVTTEYRAETSNIVNRQKNGICPVENLCMNLTSLEDMYLAIENFMQKPR